MMGLAEPIANVRHLKNARIHFAHHVAIVSSLKQTTLDQGYLRLLWISIPAESFLIAGAAGVIPFRRGTEPLSIWMRRL